MPYSLCVNHFPFPTNGTEINTVVARIKDTGTITLSLTSGKGRLSVQEPQAALLPDRGWGGWAGGLSPA